jgi:hypothetical protein
MEQYARYREKKCSYVHGITYLQNTSHMKTIMRETRSSDSIKRKMSKALNGRLRSQEMKGLPLTATPSRARCRLAFPPILSLILPLGNP